MMRHWRYWLVGVLVLLAALIAWRVVFVTTAPPPVYLYASQSGQPTLDRSPGGGNPFAAALSELSSLPALSFSELCAGLAALTTKKSGNFQQPELRVRGDLASWRFLPPPAGEKRVALVVGIANYRASGGLKDLPGAAQDVRRVAIALGHAGFTVQALSNPNRAQLRTSLKEFSRRSAAADAAALYVTGHGAEVSGTIYLLPGDYPFAQGAAALPERAVRLDAMGSALRARQANLVFYGGCRDNPF